MRKKLLPLLFLFCLLKIAACAQKKQLQTVNENSRLQEQDSIYSYGTPTGADGTGKFYMGRDIARVMGHTGAGWLERSDREREERTDLLIKALALKNDAVVADIGAGTGYFAFRISPQVPHGKVLAVDIQQEMLDMIQSKITEKGIENIQTVLGTEKDPGLPADSVDVVLMVDAYHEFSYPREMMENIVHSLKSGGQVVLVEYRAEDPAVRIKPRHKMTESQVVKEMAAVGLKLKENKATLPLQHLMIFQTPGRQ